jgi:seryl-tRNA synthetase
VLDIKLLRNDLERVKVALTNRNDKPTAIESFTRLDKDRLRILQEVEQLKSVRNSVSKEVATLKSAGTDAEDLIVRMREVGEQIKGLDDALREKEVAINELILNIPNIPHESVPIGKSEEDNIIVHTWGSPVKFTFQPKAHYELGENLGILDFERAAKVTGARFVFYKGLGARLERALINFMMDLHANEHGYDEMLPPYIVNSGSMIGTGQLPKFADDAFKLEKTDYYLIPTAEVPVTNYYQNEIIDMNELPQKFTAYSACFRSEAGSAGRDTRGIIRQHQFNKVELVKFTAPEDSYEELEKLVNNAEQVLQLLELPYQKVALCTGDLGFSSAKTYDLEVWIPSEQKYREISSCSNFEAFQATRANIRFRRDKNSKPEFVHTLNGSGLAVGRTVAAILENFQQEDGSVLIPKALVGYMGGVNRITKTNKR